MVFQSYALFPHMTVAGNVSFGLRLQKLPRAQRRQRVREMLELLELGDFAQRLPRQLSGGQRQRVALARALVMRPEVLLLDEPLSNLDARLRTRMRAELKRLHQRLRTTVIYVTHDQTEAMTLSDRICVIHEGRIMQVGRPAVLYDRPANLFVAGFIGSPPMNFFEGSIGSSNDKTCLCTEAGAVTLPPELSESLQAPADAAMPLTLGIRPEHISLHAHGEASRGPVCGLSARVELSELLGAQSLLTLVSNGQRFQVCTAAGNAPPDNSEVLAEFEPAKLRIFHSRSGKALADSAAA
jgi:multiple sugar transport system ATP-binding protein